MVRPCPPETKADVQLSRGISFADDIGVTIVAQHIKKGEIFANGRI